MNILHKLAVVLPLFATALWGQVTPNASIFASGAVFDGGGMVAPDTVTLILDGWADAGVMRTENTLWLPDGSPQVLGDLGLGSHDYTPMSGPGVYWLQFRLVDINENFQDQWISFTVLPGYLILNGSVVSDGAGVALVRDGQCSNGVFWSENVIWRPDGSPEVLGNGGLGVISYMPSGGSGQYWYQYRLVDTNLNFRDEWIPFVVP